MRSKSIQKTITALFIIFAAFSIGLSQEPPDPNQVPVQKNELMTEDDRLPFMQTEESVQTSEPTSGSLLIKTLGSMLLIVGLLFFGAWGVRKYGLFGVRNDNSAAAPELKISSSISVANGQTLSVVRFGERVLLIGSTPQSFTLLADEFLEAMPDAKNERKSVSDLLAEENLNFGKELQTAQNRLPVWNDNGGKRI